MTNGELATLLTIILNIFPSMILLYFAVYAVVGIFKKKKFPKADRQLNYSFIISAHNEGKVIGNLIESIKNNDYPQEKVKIFLVAHNCDDDTASIARAKGAIVYEYNNDNERRKGYALRYLFSRLKAEGKDSDTDAFVLMDADNVLNGKFIEKVNNAFIAEGCKNLIRASISGKNFGSNAVAACSAMYLISSNVLETRGRTVLGCSTRAIGTGLVFGKDMISGWDYVNITEDWEITVDKILENRKVVYAEDAVFYDEQPTSMIVSVKQRLRWLNGHFSVFKQSIKKVVKSLFTSPKKGGGKNKGSLLDLSIELLPLCALSAIITVVNFVITASVARFETEFLLRTAIVSGVSFVATYIVTALGSALFYILEKDKIKGVSLKTKITSSMLFPIYMAMFLPIQIVAVLKKEVEWTPIEHKDNTDINNIK